MRSSKSRSRSKANRPRTLGNIINRVFDSSGPEGKVRGTPQQIIEKYQMLAGDAQRSNDRVAAENFSQHAEHYTRMLAEAQREMATEQEQRQQSQQGQQNHQNGTGGNRNERGDFRNDRPEGRNERSDQGDGDQPYSSGFAVVGEADTSLVDLPESNRQQQPRREARPDGQSGQPRRNENRRDDRPRDDRPRDDRPRENRREQPVSEQREQPVFVSAEQPVIETREPPVAVAREPAQPEAPRFESPAQLVAQVEKAASKPRAPKGEASSDAPKTTRAPRVRKPKPAGNPEAAE